MARYISQDWENEKDPRLSIECLDPVPPKARLSPEEITRRMEKMAIFPAEMDRLFFQMQNSLKSRVGVNNFDVFVMKGVEFQAYWPAIFEFSPGEALIVETELPEVRPYWNSERQRSASVCGLVRGFGDGKRSQAHRTYQPGPVEQRLPAAVSGQTCGTGC